MKPEYERFRAELVKVRLPAFRYWDSQPTMRDLVRAQCEPFCRAFSIRYPHLKIAAGFFGKGRVEHWWLVEPDGSIVDPTIEQFGGELGPYEQFNPDTHQIRIGRCIHCGIDIHGLQKDGPKFVCSEECPRV